MMILIMQFWNKQPDPNRVIADALSGIREHMDRFGSDGLQEAIGMHIGGLSLAGRTEVLKGLGAQLPASAIIAIMAGQPLPDVADMMRQQEGYEGTIKRLEEQARATNTFDPSQLPTGAGLTFQLNPYDRVVGYSPSDTPIGNPRFLRMTALGGGWLRTNQQETFYPVLNIPPNHNSQLALDRDTAFSVVSSDPLSGGYTSQIAYGNIFSVQMSDHAKEYAGTIISPGAHYRKEVIPYYIANVVLKDKLLFQ